MAYSTIFNAFELLVAQKASIRPKLQSLSKDLFPSNGPAPKSLIEISGPSNSGKTLLLNEIIALTILPTYFNGKDSNVVLIDLDHKLSIPHLMKVAEKIIKNSGEKTSQEDMQFTIELRMQSVQIINCYSPDQFEMAMDTLEDLLVSNPDIALLAIDNIGAYYWLDTDSKLVRKETHYKNHIARLKNICRKHNIVCAFTMESNYIQTKGLRANVDYKFDMKVKPNVANSDGIVLMTVEVSGSSVDKLIRVDDYGMHFIFKWFSSVFYLLMQFKLFRSCNPT
ncbi:uncharacterized protein LOC129920275 [Episyrphus balteatus]|uniref:uncharacterized protein LOC129920275 n=1 Tax=Episyrphus balteatus TaxID=286459 RepID=UPI0024854905|nr:uncharacterized protein LOC129920275 [Episyrphus balteatus]